MMKKLCFILLFLLVLPVALACASNDEIRLPYNDGSMQYDVYDYSRAPISLYSGRMCEVYLEAYEIRFDSAIFQFVVKNKTNDQLFFSSKDPTINGWTVEDDFLYFSIASKSQIRKAYQVFYTDKTYSISENSSFVLSFSAYNSWSEQISIPINFVPDQPIATPANSMDSIVTQLDGLWWLEYEVIMDDLGWPEIDPCSPIDLKYCTGPREGRTIEFSADTVTFDPFDTPETLSYSIETNAKGCRYLSIDSDDEKWWYMTYEIIDEDTIHCLMDGYIGIYERLY